jgi:RND family efflux transporter MFP subunit
MKNPGLNFVLAIPFIALSAVFLQSCTDGNSATTKIPSHSDPIPVKVVQLQKSGSTEVITASGQLTTEDETILSFKSGGVINRVFVKEGDQVRKGQLLATLDLTEINAMVAQARFGYEKAQRDFQRITNLYRDSVATLEQLQNTETALAVAREQLEAANFNRSFSEIHAPANGYVLRKFVNAGQVVSAGDPILLTNAAVENNWILKIGVSDKQWASIKINDEAAVEIDAFPDRSFQAAVSRKAERSDPMTGAFTVELLVRNEGVRLATGMFGAARLESRATVTTWSVPYEAVLDANGNDGFVFVTNDNKTAIKQPVIIESFNGKTMRISSGLENARALIVSGSAYLTDNSPIRVLN